jgi:diguanylate cyclase (GGDEF)-like protein
VYDADSPGLARRAQPADPDDRRRPGSIVEALVSDSIGTDDGPLTVLSAGAAALARARDLDTALAVIVEAGAAAVGAQLASVFALDPDRGELELLVTLGMAEDTLEAFAAEVTGNVDHAIHRAALDRTGSLGRTGQAPDGSTLTGVDLPLVAGGGIESSVGVLTFGWPGTHEVGTAEETLLVAIADLAAAAISAHRTASLAGERAEWLERVAHADALTGLSNARTIGRVLELEVARAARQGSEVSVALFDVDGFTELNVAAGSRVGDRVLREVAAVLADSVRIVDSIARTDGDEFLLVAPGSAGMTVARRVLDAIARLEAVDGHTISVSAGIARFPQDGTDAESLIAAARATLAGASGRAAIAESTPSQGG